MLKPLIGATLIGIVMVLSLHGADLFRHAKSTNTALPRDSETLFGVLSGGLIGGIGIHTMGLPIALWIIAVLGWPMVLAVRANPLLTRKK